MEEFMSPQAFDSFLMFKVTIAIVAAYYFCKFSQRDATAFDTIYRKRIRYVYVVLIGASVVWSLIQIFKGPFAFSLPFYNMSVYGTAFPTEAMLETGIGVNANVHFSYETCRWSRLTFEQWNLSTGIADLIVGVGLLIYMFRFRKSSVRWNVKVRKFIGYTLLYVSPATIANSFHYFSGDEWFVVGAYVCITYLLCRSYKWDAIPAKLPKESISHPNIPEFEAIPPENTSRICYKNEDSIDVQKEPKKRLIKYFYSKSISSWLVGTIISLLIITIILCALRDNITVHPYAYDYYEKYNIRISENLYHFWREEPTNNYNFSYGKPINTNALVTEDVSTYFNRGLGTNVYEKFKACKIYTYDISESGYTQKDEDKFLDYVAILNNDKKAIVIDVPHANYTKAVRYIEYKTAKAEEKLTLLITFPVFAKDRSGQIFAFFNYQITNYVFCQNGIAYHFQYFNLEDVPSNKIIDTIYFQDPAKGWNIAIVICAVLFLVLCLICAILFVKKSIKKEILNKSAYFLQWYIFGMSVIQSIAIFILVLIEGLPDKFYDIYYYNAALVGAGLILINIPLLIYVAQKVEQPYSIDYLFPKWYKELFVNSFKNKFICTKLSLALLFYPLLYIAALPYGILVLVYIFAISVIFVLIRLACWVFKDDEQKEKSMQEQTYKQTEFEGDTLKEKLQLLKSMLDDGLITQEDYDRKKADILDKIQY